MVYVVKYDWYEDIKIYYAKKPFLMVYVVKYDWYEDIKINFGLQLC